MTQDIAGCPYPACDAGSMLAEIKHVNKEYRGEIKGELSDIKAGIKEIVKAISEYTSRVMVLEQAIMFLRDGEKENKAAHILLFKKWEEMERRRTAWLWDAVKLVIAAGLGGLAGSMF